MLPLQWLHPVSSSKVVSQGWKREICTLSSKIPLLISTYSCVTLSVVKFISLVQISSFHGFHSHVPAVALVTTRATSPKWISLGFIPFESVSLPSLRKQCLSIMLLKGNQKISRESVSFISLASSLFWALVNSCEKNNRWLKLIPKTMNAY